MKTLDPSLADGVTNAGPALQALLDAGEHVVIGSTDKPFLFKTSVFVPSGAKITGHSARLQHRASGTHGNKLFVIEHASDVLIHGLTVDGGKDVRVAVHMTGVVENIRIHWCQFFDHKNSSIEFADSDTDPVKARLENISLRRLEVYGICGLTGAGSGINLFPRSQVGSLPASRDVLIEDCVLDVSMGQPNEQDHGPQCLKINNTSGVKLKRLKLRGGHVACLVVSNGCRNVEIATVDARFANCGLRISDGHNTATTQLGQVQWRDLMWANDGVLGGTGASVIVDAEGTTSGVRQ